METHFFFKLYCSIVQNKLLMILFIFYIVIALIKTNELKKFNLFINFVSALKQRLNIFFLFVYTTFNCNTVTAGERNKKYYFSSLLLDADEFIRFKTTTFF